MPATLDAQTSPQEKYSSFVVRRGALEGYIVSPCALCEISIYVRAFSFVLSAILIPFPIELPDELFEEWDSLQSGTQFAAFHYDLRNDRLLRHNGISAHAVLVV